MQTNQKTPINEYFNQCHPILPRRDKRSPCRGLHQHLSIVRQTDAGPWGETAQLQFWRLANACLGCQNGQPRLSTRERRRTEVTSLSMEWGPRAKDEQSSAKQHCDDQHGGEHIELTHEPPSPMQFARSCFRQARRRSESSQCGRRPILGEGSSQVCPHQAPSHPPKELCPLCRINEQRTGIGLLQDVNQLLILWVSLFW
jgi:hypothetical protein